MLGFEGACLSCLHLAVAMSGFFPGGTERGGPVYLASDPAMLTVVGVNSKTTGGGSAHVRLDDGGPQKIRGYTRTF